MNLLYLSHFSVFKVIIRPVIIEQSQDQPIYEMLHPLIMLNGSPRLWKPAFMRKFVASGNETFHFA